MKKNDLKQQVAAAVAACEDKKADRLAVLELEKNSGAFTDYFVICSATNPRQLQAISDEVGDRLEKLGLRPKSIEGYKQAEWVLLDYVDFVVHVFSEKARGFYDLERLWKSAKRLHADDLKPTPRPRAKKAAGTTAKKPTKKAAATAGKPAKKAVAKKTASAPRKRTMK
jgi:ribosome-associated protein